MEKNINPNEALKTYAKAEFDKLDKDKKGYISTSDFADLILATRQKASLPPLNNLELGKIMKSVDPQGSGKVSFEMWFKFLRMGKRVADTASKQQKEKQENIRKIPGGYQDEDQRRNRITAVGKKKTGVSSSALYSLE